MTKPMDRRQFWGLTAVGTAGFLAVWYLAGVLQLSPKQFLPMPHEVVLRLVDLLSNPFAGGTLLEHMLASLKRFGAGFGLAVLIGVPLGLAAGRVGNFINGELWGRAADPSLPWAMVFADGVPRHPSQIYQFLLEGVLLFVLLWLYARKPRASGRVAAVFLGGYGVMRFIAEYFREPDAHLGLLAGGLSMGQWLCVPMVLGGIALWSWAGRKRD